ISEIDRLMPMLIGHATVDTFAKKLFLRNKPEDKNNLYSLKYLLGCFFVYEQIELKSYWDQFTSTGRKDVFTPTRTSYEGQKVQKDFRYDVFLSTLLSEKDIILDERIKVISWNYDSQFEIAYQEFNPNSLLKVYPHPNLFNDFNLNKSPQIVKLNGTATYLYSEKNRRSDDESIFKPMYELNELKADMNYGALPSFFDMLRLYSDWLNTKKEDYIPFINFAWEKNVLSKKTLEFAKEIMHQTEVLVVIGYSFPNFNRTIDLELLKDTFFNRVYIQTVKENIDDLSQRFKWLIDRKVEIIPYSDTYQFFIPYELDQTFWNGELKTL
ncbi:MAG: hypothetical protein SFU99_14845, partial [Saprospiraceae bacterium]|nr:hypothetical protein [Saprospiraceae bacterium]